MLTLRSWMLIGKTTLDVGALAAAFCLAFLLRFEGSVPAEFAELMLFYLPWLVAVKIAVLRASGNMNASWRFTGLREAVRLSVWLTAVAIGLAAWMLAERVAPKNWFGSEIHVLPFGVILLDLALSFLALVGVRATARLLSEYRAKRTAAAKGSRCIPTLLVGAGRAGALLATEISARPDTGIRLCGFLDDDPNLRGMQVAGLPVRGSIDGLKAVIERHGIQQLIITIASASEPAMRRIKRLCKASGLPTKIIPPLHELANGRLNLSQLRELSIDDLLLREPVTLDLSAFAKVVRGRTVLVTGAGGSIGSELCRLIARLYPATLVLVDQAENSLFHIHWSLAETFPQLHIVPRIADVCDERRIDSILLKHRPSFIFHAAAHKHVPMMEWNPGEAVKNNVLGTRSLAALAATHHVAWFVMISTDKAVNPSSVMGVSKRVAELYIQALAQHSATRFMTVRFGNVLGSAGSVIPTFQRQIAAGGPVTVTHPEMRRYFMTIPEACQLVLQAAGMGRGGELFILDMGEPVKIVDLARELIRLYGLTPDQDVEIRFTGLRPGEKLFEEIALGEEDVRKTGHQRIFAGKVRTPDLATINRQIDELGALAVTSDAALIRAKFKEIVPTYLHVSLRLDPPVEPALNGAHGTRSLPLAADPGAILVDNQPA